RKQKPSTAAKKRPVADARKPVKAAAAEKAVAPVATAREKDRPKAAAAPVRKTPEETAAAVAPAPVEAAEPHHATERPVDGKSTAPKSESSGTIPNDARKGRVGPRASAGEGH